MAAKRSQKPAVSSPKGGRWVYNDGFPNTKPPLARTVLTYSRRHNQFALATLVCDANLDPLWLLIPPLGGNCPQWTDADVDYWMEIPMPPRREA